ncbi:MAG: hypothetical protein ACI8VT_004235, partial [Saprospiraceae bacterium]
APNSFSKLEIIAEVSTGRLDFAALSIEAIEVLVADNALVFSTAPWVSGFVSPPKYNPRKSKQEIAITIVWSLDIFNH